MYDEPVIGAIRITRSDWVAWFRVTTREGWVSVLRRVLFQQDLTGSTVCLQSWDGTGFIDAFGFEVPDEGARGEPAEHQPARSSRIEGRRR